MPEKPNPRPDTYFVWEPPNRLTTVLLSLRLIDRMKSWVDKGLEDGEEVGGLLLGRLEGHASADPMVTVEDCETVEISHQRGPTYTPNDKDKKNIAKRIEWWQANGRGRMPVGLVRSHKRNGLYLDAADFALFQQYFPDPRAVFLLVRPGTDPTGGFFFWEERDVHRQATYAPFPFDPEKLRADKHIILGSPDRVTSKSVLTPVIATPAREKAPSRIAAIPAWLSRWRPSGLAWLTAAAIVLALMAAGLYWTGWNRGTSGGVTDFGLNIDHLGRALRLTWDPRASALAHAGQATLSIRDGETERKLALNSRQLAHGSTLYVPASDDVEFRLQVRNGSNVMSDAIRSVSPLKPAPASNTQTPIQTANSTPPTPTSPPAPAESADRIDMGKLSKTAPSEETRPQIAKRRRSRGSAERSQAEVANLAEPARVEAPPVPPPSLEMPQIEVAPQPPPVVEPVARPVRRSFPTVSVNYEAAPESSLRQKIEKVPILRLFQRNQYRGGDNFIPARPVREVKPQLRPAVARELPGEWRVELRVTIDRRGEVLEVESRPGADERLVLPAVSAIRDSRFEPAQLNGRDVSSRLLVTYRFRNPPQAAVAARTAP